VEKSALKIASSASGPGLRLSQLNIMV